MLEVLNRTPLDLQPPPLQWAQGVVSGSGPSWAAAAPGLGFLYVITTNLTGPRRFRLVQASAAGWVPMESRPSEDSCKSYAWTSYRMLWLGMMQVRADEPKHDLATRQLLEAAAALGTRARAALEDG